MQCPEKPRRERAMGHPDATLTDPQPSTLKPCPCPQQVPKVMGHETMVGPGPPSAVTLSQLPETLPLPCKQVPKVMGHETMVSPGPPSQFSLSQLPETLPVLQQVPKVMGHETMVGPGPAPPQLMTTEVGSLLVRAGHKRYFFDACNNAHGQFLRITEVRHPHVTGAGAPPPPCTCCAQVPVRMVAYAPASGPTAPCVTFQDRCIVHHAAWTGGAASAIGS